MTRRVVLFGLALVLIPSLVRGVWFYQGVVLRRAPVATPDYDSLSVPQPPVSTAEAQTARRHEGGALVLVDQTHLNNFQSGELEPLLQDVGTRGGQVEFVTASDSGSLGTRLAAASALVVASPSTPYAQDEVRRVQAFVARGGRLLVLTDPTRWTQPYDLYSFSSTTTLIDDSSAANTLLAPFDITVADDYLYNLTENEGNFRNVLLSTFAASPLTANLERVAFYAAHSIASPSGSALIAADGNTRSSKTDLGGGLAAAVLAANERVLAVGDLSFVAPPYDAVADNARWIANLADFLVGGQPSRSPADFPYIFSATPSVGTLGGLEMTPDLVKALSGVESALHEIGLSLKVAQDSDTAANRIVLARYEDATDQEVLAGEFGIVLPGTSEDLKTAGKLQIPGWPLMDPASVGLMLVERTGGQTTLTLIAPDSSGLVELLDALAGRDFSACLSEEALAVCVVEASSTKVFDFGFVPDIVPTP